MKPVRGVERRFTVLPAGQIPIREFGEETRTVNQDGALVTIIITKQFQLVCGCTVTQAQSLASYCPACLEQVAGDLVTRQAVFEATPCVDHYLTCQYPYCEFRGGCDKHMATGPDGKIYCRTHFHALNEALLVSSVSERHGELAGVSLKLWRSLFS